LTTANWTTLAVPQSIDGIDEPEILSNKKPVVGMYTIVLNFEGI